MVGVDQADQIAERGDRRGVVERELVAAVVGALVIGEKKAQAPEPVAVAAAGEPAGSSWRSYGRLRQMR